MKPSYLEIGSQDEVATKQFFQSLFGWTFTPMEHGGVFDTGDIKTGLHGGDEQPGIVVYFQVPDIAAAVQTVRRLGGKADDPSPAEPGFGRFATCHGPGGVRFGLHQLA